MKISTRIIIGFVISAACIIGLAVFAHSNIDGINSSRAWVAHTVQVLIEKETLESDLKDLESRIRGYVASGDERFLDGTENLKKNIDRGFVSLMALTADNPRQQQNLKELSPLLSQRLQQLERLKSARSEGGIAAARNFLHLPENNDTWRWVNAMNKIKSEEEHLLKVRTDATIDSIKQTETLVVLFALGSMLIVGVSGSVIVTGLSRSIAALIQGTDRVAAGELNFRIPITTKDELAVLARAFNAMIDRLRTLSEMQVTTDWHRSGLNKFSVILQGQRKLDSAGQIFLEELVPMLAAHYGALYAVTDEDDGAGLKLVSIYGGDRSAALPEFIEIGHGLVGQCARDQKRIILHDIPADRFTIKSGLVETKPFEVLIVPLIFEGRTRGVLELASLTEFTPAHLDFLEELSGWIASVLNAIAVSAQVEHLLNESQMMNEELQAQQEELECQQDELRSTNEELEEKAEALDIQNQEVLDKNIELEQMQSNLEAKASELAMASKYKSEFLANMSHDLRTPLNSLLIFSELLAENDEKNLQDFQIDYAKNIHSAGKTLLSLIDDVLDLSKIESGTVVLDMVDVQLADIVSEMQRNFEKAAQNSGLEFEIKVADDAPKTIRSDSKRLSQLLTNLLSNAFKFTPQGSVKLHVAMTEDKQDVSFQVIDTGIGIAKEKQELVFEAFRQADNTIKGKYGGTGLGLAICRQLSELLGGHIELQSAVSEGCKFTVVLPPAFDGRRRSSSTGQSKPSGQVAPDRRAMRTLEKTLESSRGAKMLEPSEVEDDRRDIKPDDRVLLVIEDDPAFARTLLDLARKHSFKGVVALCGADGMELARRIMPDGITLDLQLPDMQGWTVLDQLKQHPDTRHIPVHIISVDKERQRSLEVGAIGFIEKPVSVSSVTEALNRIKDMMSRERGRILLVEHDAGLREQLRDLMTDKDVEVSAVENGAEALAAMGQESFDCVIVDMDLNDVKGTELIEQLQRSDSAKPPVLVYADRALTAEESNILNRLRRSSTVKDVDSPERLLSEVLLFLHRVEASLPESKRRMVDSARQHDLPLSGRKVLIVDDDPRNIAAMKGALLKQKMDLLVAENGKEAIQQLNQAQDIELVLMDMMMPEMDGYEAMQMIRRERKFRDLPIIAVTAKAMKEDRRKCLEAGASDYISKPVDKNQLLSLLRVWLYRR